MSDKARIFVTLELSFEGEDVDRYNEAMDEALAYVTDAGYDIVSRFDEVEYVTANASG